MKCRLCKKDKSLIKAHIIPKTFYDFLYPSDDNSSLIMVRKNKHIKRRPVGSYDMNILCKDCDSDLGLYDEYGKKVFLEKKLEKHPQTESAFIIRDVDYEKLSFFIISLLWRAGISSLDEYGFVQLNKYEEILRDIIYNKKYKKLIDYPFIITQFEKDGLDGIVDKSFLNPVKLYMDKRRFYLFYLPNCYSIYIKVDKQKMQSSFSKIAFKKDGNLFIINRGKYKNSKEFKLIVDIVKSGFTPQT
ncbi:MAG: hypothetical protein L3J07_01085 [Candidatus Magasanikbacteria bacterium]|nr:hypothetical protein [Candidatus Magasanikbacteria bacterium]